MIQHFCYTKNLDLVKIILTLVLFNSFYPFFTLKISTSMRIHPISTKRNVITRDGFNSNSSINDGHALKKLRKLPHVFSNVLELPFRSDADVAVEDSLENIRFIAEIEADGNDVVGEVRVHAIEIHPGVTKIVVRKDGGGLDLFLDQLNVDTWRFRLPRSAQPELASVVYVNGEIIVTVPKGNLREFGNGRDVWHGDSQPVLVQ